MKKAFNLRRVALVTTGLGVMSVGATYLRAGIVDRLPSMDWSSERVALVVAGIVIGLLVYGIVMRVLSLFGRSLESQEQSDRLYRLVSMILDRQASVTAVASGPGDDRSVPPVCRAAPACERCSGDRRSLV